MSQPSKFFQALEEADEFIAESELNFRVIERLHSKLAVAGTHVTEMFNELCALRVENAALRDAAASTKDMEEA